MAETVDHNIPASEPTQATISEPPAVSAADVLEPPPTVNVRRLRPVQPIDQPRSIPEPPVAPPPPAVRQDELRVEITIRLWTAGGEVVHHVGEDKFQGCAKLGNRKSGYRAFIQFADTHLLLAKEELREWCHEQSPEQATAQEQQTQRELDEELESRIPDLKRIAPPRPGETIS